MRIVTLTTLVVGVLLGAVLIARSAEAQVSPHRVQQRYNEATKGKDIDDWVRRMEDKDPRTRLEAVKSLGLSGEPDAIEHMIEAMADPDDAVKIKAIDFLGKLRATDATTIMVQKLFMRDTGDLEQQRILVALGRIADPKTIRPITEFLEQDANPITQGTAVYTLGEIGDSSVIAPLQKIQIESTNPDLARLAGESVTKVNRRLSPATVAVTIPALEEDAKPGGAGPPGVLGGR